MLNLLSNAIKFTLKGSIKVKLSLTSKSLLKCSVTDTGIGISEEALSKLFTPFKKVEDKEGINKAGCGLGLSVSKSLSENLGGYVTAKSTPGTGSTFTFAVAANLEGNIASTMATMAGTKAIPGQPPGIYEKVRRQFTTAIPSEKESPKPRPVVGRKYTKIDPKSEQKGRSSLIIDSVGFGEPEKDDGKKCPCPKILVVDDTPLNVFALKQLLLKFGLAIDEATNGAEAVEKVKARAQYECCKRYSLIFMDCNMPVMDGLEATRQINDMINSGEISYTPVIGLSAYSGEAELQQCRASGMNETLCKPITIAKLDEKLIEYGLRVKKSLFQPISIEQTAKA